MIYDDLWWFIDDLNKVIFQNLYLVGGIPTPSEKWWSSSIGMMTFPIYEKTIMFQTTNQRICDFQDLASDMFISSLSLSVSIL